MASHVAAFRILYGLRVKLSEHIGKLSLGFLSDTSTGAIKKTIEQNIEKICDEPTGALDYNTSTSWAKLQKHLPPTILTHRSV